MAPISGDKSFIVFWFWFSVEGEGEELSMLLSLPMQVVPEGELPQFWHLPILLG